MPRRVKKVIKGRPYRPAQLGIENDEVWGVFVGGCIDERNAWSIWEGVDAHAHNDTKSAWFGWICVLEPRHVLTPTGRLASTLLHELAHILVPNEYHTEKWKRMVVDLGAGNEVVREKLTPPRGRQ